MRASRTLSISLLWVASSLFEATLSAHQPHDPIAVVAASPNFANDNIVIASTGFLSVSIGVYLPIKSNDGGSTWTALRGLPNLVVNAIEYSPSFSQDGIVVMAGTGGLYRSSDSGTTWTPVNIPGATNIKDAAFSPTFSGDGTAFAISPTGLYKSTDQANTFKPVTGPQTSSTLSVIGISPNFASDQTLLIGSAAGEIFKSANAGASWTNTTSGLGLAAITALTFSPTYSVNPTVFSGTLGTGVYVTQNGAGSWTASNQGLSDLNVTAVVLYPDFSQNGTVVATTNTGVFLSTNKVKSWSKTSSPNRPLSPQTKTHFITVSTALTASGSPEIFLGMFEGMWKSTDQGNSWTYLDIIPTYLVRDLKISPSFPTDRSIFATNYGGGNLFSSTAGQTWSILNTGFPNPYPDPAAFSPNFTADQILFSGIASGLERTSNAGSSWISVPALGVTCYPRSLAVSPNFANDQVVLIGLSNGQSNNPPTLQYHGKTFYNEGMFFSSDGGLNWEPTSLNGPTVLKIAISSGYTRDQTAFGATASQGLYKSTDGGHRWTQVFLLSTDHQVLELALSPSYPTDQTVFAGTSHSGIYKSTDGGTTWSELPGTSILTAISFAVSPNYSTDQTLFAGTFEAGLLKSSDGGASFQPVNLAENFITGVAISPAFASDLTMFASSYVGIFKSTDAGNTWAFAYEPNRMEDSRIETVLLSAGQWTSVPDKKASGSAYSTTTQAGATATINFVGSGIQWIGPTGPSGGSGSVTIDGVASGSANLNSAQFTEEQVVFQKSGLTCGPHSAVFTASSVSGQSVIYLDAVDILRDGCVYPTAATRSVRK